MNSGNVTPADKNTPVDMDELPGTDVEEWIKKRNGAPVVTPGVPAPSSEHASTTNASGVTVKVCMFDRTLDAETVSRLQDILVVCTEAVYALDTIIRNSENYTETHLLNAKRTVFASQQEAIRTLLSPIRTINISKDFGGVEYTFI